MLGLESVMARDGVEWNGEDLVAVREGLSQWWGVFLRQGMENDYRFAWPSRKRDIRAEVRAGRYREKSGGEMAGKEMCAGF